MSEDPGTDCWEVNWKVCTPDGADTQDQLHLTKKEH